MVVVGSADSFEDIHAKVQVEKLPAVFYYTAVWCGPCRVMAPVIEKMSRQYHKIPVYKVDIDMYAYDWICAFSFRVIDGFRFLHPYYTAYSFLEIFKKEDSATRLKGYYENDGVHDASADSALLSNAFPEVYLCAHERGWWQGRRACGKAASSASICCHRPRHHEGVTLSCLYITPPHQDTLMGMTFSKAGVCDRVKELWPLSLPQMSMMLLCCHSHVFFILFVR